jgi:hypothetical protein
MCCHESNVTTKTSATSDVLTNHTRTEDKEIFGEGGGTSAWTSDLTTSHPDQKDNSLIYS